MQEEWIRRSGAEDAVNELKEQLKIADHKAGEAERKYNRFTKWNDNYQNLIEQRKQDAGFDSSVSFDLVWGKALSSLLKEQGELK